MAMTVNHSLGLNEGVVGGWSAEATFVTARTIGRTENVTKGQSHHHNGDQPARRPNMICARSAFTYLGVLTKPV